MYAFTEDRNVALRAWAKGSLPDMAGVELLIRSGWASKLDQAGWIEKNGDYAYPKVGLFLASAGYLSGGERRQITILGSLFGQRRDEDDVAIGTVLAHDLGNVDHSFIRLFQTAIGIAAGMYETWPGED